MEKISSVHQATIDLCADLANRLDSAIELLNSVAPTEEEQAEEVVVSAMDAANET